VVEAQLFGVDELAGELGVDGAVSAEDSVAALLAGIREPCS